jgi:hypothetical protein
MNIALNRLREVEGKPPFSDAECAAFEAWVADARRLGDLKGPPMTMLQLWMAGYRCAVAAITAKETG